MRFHARPVLLPLAATLVAFLIAALLPPAAAAHRLRPAIVTMTVASQAWAMRVGICGDLALPPSCGGGLHCEVVRFNLASARRSSLLYRKSLEFDAFRRHRQVSGVSCGKWKLRHKAEAPKIIGVVGNELWHLVRSGMNFE